MPYYKDYVGLEMAINEGGYFYTRLVEIEKHI